MKLCWPALFLSVCCSAQAASPIALPVSWSLAGQWRAHDANDASFSGWRGSDADWRKLRVPANWYSAGWDHQGALWYRTEFSLPPLAPDTMATLVFDGVDYQAQVWLNRQRLAQHEGYFQRFAVDISDNVTKYNRLAVRVDSPYEDPKTVWPLHKNLMKGILNQHDARPGGAWTPQGQDANSGGIWAPVRLRLSRGAAIDNLMLRPDWSQGLAHPQLSVEIDYRALKAGSATLELRATPANFSGRRYQLSEKVTLSPSSPNTDGKQRLAVKLPMPDARLWWAHGYGKPNLYRITATLRDEQGIMDRQSSRTGLRKIEQQPDNRGWLLNGKRIYLRGTNYIGSAWLSTMNDEKYRRDLTLVQRMNANAIRVHGHVAGRALYRQADEMGMMIWQDVPLQWGYNDSDAFAANAARQTQEMVEQFGNSPAIVVWGGQNEPPFNSPWMEKRFPDWNNNLNRKLTQRVADTLAQDRTRIVHPFSSVEEHYWQGWYFGTMTDVLQPAKTGIITEFGAQALPHLATLKTIIPAKDWWPASTAPGDPQWASWKYHNFQPIQTFQFAKLSRGDNMAEFIANTQRYQADLVAMAAESYRRQRFQPVTALFQFMFVEIWPSINWGVMDYLRQPKAGYYALQRAYQPLLPSIEPVTPQWQANQQVRLRLWTINDSWQPLPGTTLGWTVRQGQRTLDRGERKVDIAADEGVKRADVAITPSSNAPLEIKTWINDAQGQRKAENQLLLRPTAAP
ncbi:glycoside hydrolase family 2 protein [Mixta tenebrionis]|uniref:beta-mannosidase n=1 Tax=Mixta tenebrionis TaxID=2562439 RepID=A0A506VCA3_9GAMM|nr:sugar-binding domain-containing protein [Mixta tenebrionis]TPW43367.1 glycoside hydrolase family 2 [Mixta tenebrionis]